MIDGAALTSLRSMKMQLDLLNPTPQFFVPFSAENPINPFLCRQKLSGTLHVHLSCIFLLLPPLPHLQFHMQFGFESVFAICTVTSVSVFSVLVIGHCVEGIF